MQNYPRFSDLPDEFPALAIGQIRITNMNIPLKIEEIQEGRVNCQYMDTEQYSVCEMPVHALQSKSKLFLQV